MAYAVMAINAEPSEAKGSTDRKSAMTHSNIKPQKGNLGSEIPSYKTAQLKERVGSPHILMLLRAI